MNGMTDQSSRFYFGCATPQLTPAKESRDSPILLGQARIDGILVKRKMQLQYFVCPLEKENMK